MSDFKHEKCISRELEPSRRRSAAAHAVLRHPEPLVSNPRLRHAGKLEKAVEAEGGFCIWLPKFHACCNAIEYVWGNRKKAHRKVCDFKMDTLRKTGYKTMLSVDPSFVQKAFRKARNFMTALRGGADVLSMFKQVANIKKERYVSHRRPAPSQYS